MTIFLDLLDLDTALLGRVSLVCISVCLFVHVSFCKILNRSSYLFARVLPSDKDHAIFKKNCPRVRVGVEGPNFGLIRDTRKKNVLITAKW